MSVLSSRRTVALLLALAVSAGLLVSPVRADVTISAAPSLLEVSATPGGTGSQDITVTNAGSEPFSVSAEIAPYKDAEGELSAVPWLKVEPSSFELAPGQRRAVKVSISIPRDASSGGRYAMVAFRTGAVAQNGSMVGVAAQVGVPFLVTVQGPSPLVQQPHLEGIVPVLEASGSLGFRAAVENRGNTHFYARGSVDVMRKNGSPWGRLLLRDTTAVLPGSRELVYSDRPIAFDEGASYRARATVSFGEGTPEITKEIEFDAVAGVEIEEVLPRSTPDGGLEVNVRLRNTGGIGVIPRVMMAIRGEDGRVVGVLSPNSQPLVVPGQALEMDARYPGRLAPGSYDLIARAEYASLSAQSEVPFEVVTPTAGASESVPVSKWAAAPTRTAKAPADPAVVAGSAPIPVPAAPSPDPGSPLPDLLKVALPVLAIGLVGLIVFRRKRNGEAVASPHVDPLALPAARFLGSVFSGLPRRRTRRQVSDEVLAALMPPPPVYLLPSAEEAGAANRSGSDADGRVATPGVSRFGWLEDWIAASPDSLPVERRTWSMGFVGRAGGSDRRAENRLARAVAEKSEALVREAARAAQSGDQLAVDRLSRQALQLDPRNVDAWLWLAASCGSEQSARLCLEAVQLLDPDNPRLKHALAALDGGTTTDKRLDPRWLAARRRAQRRGEGAFGQPGN